MSTMNQPMNDLIASVKELDAKAAKGPWVADWHRVRDDNCGTICYQPMGMPRLQWEGIKNLVAFYRTACPQLADRCEKLEKALELAKEVLNGITANPVSYAYNHAIAALSEINKLTT